MNYGYETCSHGTKFFPIGLHKTAVPPNCSLGRNSKYNILYSHWHSEFELLYLSRSHCVFVIDGEEYPMSAGEVIFIPSNSLHSAYRTVNSSESVFYAIVFSKRLLGEPGDVISEKYISPVLSGELRINTVFNRKNTWHAEVIDLLIEIMSLYDYTPYDNEPSSDKHPELFIKTDKYCAEITIKASILRIWKLLISHAEKSESVRTIDRTNRERVRKAIDFINQHYSEPLTLDQIAAEVYKPRVLFSHIQGANPPKTV